MPWFLAKIVFRIVCGNGRHTPQFDEQLRMIGAGSRAAAVEKAVDIGQQEQDSFLNQKQQLVQWRFVAVTEIYCLAEHMDGAEICCRIHETFNAEAFEADCHQKSANIQQEPLF